VRVEEIDAQEFDAGNRRELEKIDGNTLSVKTREGATLNVQLADDARISALGA